MPRTSHDSTVDVPAVAPNPQRRRTWILLALAVAGAAVAAVVIALTTAGAPPNPADAPAVLVVQPNFQPGAATSCLVHQTQEPNTAYMGGPDSKPPQQLTFLAYYTAAGKEPFCDGQPATEIDKTWAQLYVQLTSNSDNVSAILGSG